MQLKISALAVAVAAALALAAPAIAHDDAAGVDTFMGDKEKFFQVIDAPAAPAFELADADGNPVALSDFADKVVVLNFVFASCTDVCPLHSELIASVQEKINITPMKDMVQFITVTTDPSVDTPEVMKAYGAARGLDPSNWLFLTTRAGQPEDATRKLANTYNVAFEPLDDGQQMHGVVTNVIDRGGRFAAKFHGLRFDPVNLVLYINGLINEAPAQAETGWWSRIKGAF